MRTDVTFGMCRKCLYGKFLCMTLGTVAVVGKIYLPCVQHCKVARQSALVLDW
jgi:hypothetical protein